MVDLDPLIREYQSIYTAEFLQRLERIQQTPEVDPVIRRQLSLWQQVAEGELVDSALASLRTELHQEMDNYQFQHRGWDYTISQITSVILPEEQDHEVRRRTWTGLLNHSQLIIPKLRKLMLQTNAYWQERGYANANTPRLQMFEVNEAIVRQIIANIEEATRPIAHLLLEKCEPSWDWRFTVLQLPRSFDQPFMNNNVNVCLKKTYKTLGIDVERLPIQFTEISAIQGIWSHNVRIPYDIILSYGPISGIREYFALLHVLGEACYFANLDPDLPYPFRRHAPQVVAAGFATLSSWLLWEYDWLEEFTNMPPELIVVFSQQMRNYELLNLRHYASFALFEMDSYQALAEDPNTDLDALYRQHMETFLQKPIGDRWAWAAKPWLIDPQGRPLFIRYVLGLAVAATLAEYLHGMGDSLFSKEFGKLFQSDLVRQGAYSPWLERLQLLTAKSLTPFPMSWSQA